MVYFKTRKQNSVEYISVYHGSKFLQYLGRVDSITPEYQNYIRIKWTKLLRGGRGMKLSEIKPGAGFETEFEVVTVGPIQKFWQCFKCNNKGSWRKADEFSDKCPLCGALASTKPKTGLWIQDRQSLQVKDDTASLYLDLWNKQVNQYKQGDKLRLINGYARDNMSGGVNISTGRYGGLDVI